MITAALGFAAMENAFFLFSSFADGDLLATLLTGNQRFIGATLLHTVSSGIIGAALAISFYKPRWKIPLGVLAFIGAVIFHTLFNTFLSTEAQFQQVMAFGIVWAGIALLLLLFEKIKTIAR